MLFKRAVLNPADDPSQALAGTPVAGRLEDVRSAVEAGEQVTVTARNYRYVADAIRTCSDWEIAMAVVDPTLSLSEPQLTFHMESQPEALAFSEVSAELIEERAATDTEDEETENEEEETSPSALAAGLTWLRATASNLREAAARRLSSGSRTGIAIVGVVLVLLLLAFVAFGSPVGFGGDSTAAAQFEVSIAELETNVTAGDSFSVGYTVENTEDASGSQEIEFLVDGTVEETTTVELGPGGTATGQFSYDTSGQAGNVLEIGVASADDTATGAVTVSRPPANVTLSMSDHDEEVTAGESFTVGYGATNDGGTAATRTVTFTVGTSEVDSGTVDIDPGETATGEFTYTPGRNESGALSVAIQTGNQTVPATVTVLTPEQSMSFPVSLDAPTEMVAGTPLVVEATVENQGNESVFQTLTADAGPLGSQEASPLVDPGEQKTTEFTFETTASQAGESIDVTASSGDDEATATVSVAQATANFEVAVENATVSGGQTLSVPVEITNTGSRRGTQTITGTVRSIDLDEAAVTLDAGESTTETFTFQTTPDDLGTATLTVTSDDSEATATVTVEEGAPVLDPTVTSTNSPVSAGETLTAELAVENAGPWDGTGSVTVDGRVGRLARRERE
jgi:hypothetical protein